MAAAKKQPKAQQPVTVDVQEQTLATSGAWTPERIGTAERQVDQGTYTYAAELCERMLCDDRIGGVSKKLDGIAALPLEFESGVAGVASEDDPLAQALEQDWWNMLSEEHTAHLVEWAVLLGFSVLHIAGWEPGQSGRLLPKIETWSPRSIAFDRSRGKWVALTSSGRVDIEPGDGSWIVWTPYGAKRPCSRAPWRFLGYSWLLKQYAIGDWGLFSNRMGQGILVATNASGTLSIDDSGRKELGAKLASMGRRAVAPMPDGWDLKLLESTARTWETFKAQIDFADTAAAIALAGQNLSTQVTGGSLAAASVHQVIEAQRIRSIAEGLSTCIRSQLLTWWAALNFGPAAQAPWPRYQTERELDPAELAKRLQPVGDFLGKLADRGVSVNVLEFCERFGVSVPLAEDGDVTMGKAAPAVAPAPGTAQEDHSSDPSPQASIRSRIDAIQALASGTQDGGDYTDRVEQGYLDAAVKALGPDIDAVLAAVRSSDSPEALRVELARAYADMDPAAFASLLEQAETLAHMAGRVSVLQDL
jgi:phage gp29-like protein